LADLALRRIPIGVLAGGILATLFMSSFNAPGPRAPGFLPAPAHPIDRSIPVVAAAWNRRAFGSPADVNALLAVRCERSTPHPESGSWRLTQPPLSATAVRVPRAAVVL